MCDHDVSYILRFEPFESWHCHFLTMPVALEKKKSIDVNILEVQNIQVVS